MPFDHPGALAGDSWGPSGNPQWESASGGLPSLPPPQREVNLEPAAEQGDSREEPASSEQRGSRAGSPVAEWLGWSPTSWRARDTR